MRRVDFFNGTPQSRKSGEIREELEDPDFEDDYNYAIDLEGEEE